MGETREKKAFKTSDSAKGDANRMDKNDSTLQT